MKLPWILRVSHAGFGEHNTRAPLSLWKQRKLMVAQLITKTASILLALTGILSATGHRPCVLDQ
jgi:hypothetical protein